MKKRENIVTASIALRLRDVLDLLGKRAVLGLARVEVGHSRNRDAFVALSCAWTLDGTGSPNELR